MEIDLTGGDGEENANRLSRYLNSIRVKVKAIEEDYVSRQRQDGCQTEGRVERSLSQSNPLRQPSPVRSRTLQVPVQRKKTKVPRTRLRVTMPDGDVIEHLKAIDTWIEVILKLGPDRVLEVDEGQIISTSPNFRPDRPEMQHGQYYIAKDYSTKDKKRLLEKIASRLGVRLKVEIVEKS